MGWHVTCCAYSRRITSQTMYRISKMPVQTSKLQQRIIHTKTKKFILTYVPKWVFNLTDRLHFIINALIVQYFIYNWQYIYNTRSQLEVLILIVYQVITHKKCSECPPPESMHAWTRLITGYRTLSNIPGPLRMVGQATKMRWLSVPSFSIGAEYTRVSRCPHRQKSRGLRSRERVGCTWKTRRIAETRTSALVLVCVTHSWTCPIILGTACTLFITALRK